MSDVPSPRPSCNPSTRSASAAPSPGSTDTAQLAAELRAVAGIASERHPELAKRLLVRAERLESGTTLEEMAAEGDTAAQAVLWYERQEQAAVAAGAA